MDILYSFLGFLAALLVFWFLINLSDKITDYHNMKKKAQEEERRKIPYSLSYNRYPPVEPALLTRNDIRGLENRLDDIINEFGHISLRLEDIESACFDHAYNPDLKDTTVTAEDILANGKAYGEAPMPHNPPTIE